jgi:hypothetical protein
MPQRGVARVAIRCCEDVIVATRDNCAINSSLMTRSTNASFRLFLNPKPLCSAVCRLIATENAISFVAPVLIASAILFVHVTQPTPVHHLHNSQPQTCNIF